MDTKFKEALPFILYIPVLQTIDADTTNLGTDVCVESKVYLLIGPTYCLNRLLRFINKYKLEQTMYVLLPYTFLNTEIHNVCFSNGTNLDLYKLAITKKNLIKGCVDGYYAYLKKHNKARKEERKQILYTHDAQCNGSFDELFKNGYIVPGAFKSSYILGPQVTAIRNTLINQYKQQVIPDFQQICLPKFTTEEHFARSNHIRLPQHSYLVAKINKDALPLKELYGHLFKSWSLNPNEVKVNGVSTFGVCEVFWSYLENKKVSSFKYFDMTGYSLRNEGHATKSLERLDAFCRVETIFGFETQQDLLDHLQGYIEKVKIWFNTLDLKYRIVKVASWTPGAHSPAVCTYDVEAYLPYKDQWLEIANASHNGQIFPAEFNVKGHYTNAHIYSGCASIGIERVLYAVIEQKGYKHLLP